MSFDIVIVHGCGRAWLWSVVNERDFAMSMYKRARSLSKMFRSEFSGLQESLIKRQDL